jgi:hypothetical protein
VDSVHTSADTERFVYQDSDWIWLQIIFTTITVRDTGLDFVANCVHILADTERFVYRDLDWIRSRIIFTTITVLGHRIGFFRGSCAYFSGYRMICVSGLGLDSVADHFYYDYCIGTPECA